jgi:predicted Zn-dependent protease
MGVKWGSLPVGYSVNPTTQEPLDDEFVLTAISNATKTWDNQVSGELFTPGVTDYSAVYGKLDGKNSIAFAGNTDPNVIAITTVWYYRSTGQIIESDMLFNEYWTWGDANTDGSQMDIQNIATHEFGHVIGLADLYTNSCKEVTMYGYSNLEEVKKQTLEPSDIAGIQKIYG